MGGGVGVVLCFCRETPSSSPPPPWEHKEAGAWIRRRLEPTRHRKCAWARAAQAGGGRFPALADWGPCLGSVGRRAGQSGPRLG